MTRTDESAPKAELHELSQDDPEFAEVDMLVDQLRGMTRALVERNPQLVDPEELMKLATACCVYAGSLYGELVVLGAARDQDKRCFVKAMTENLRNGIDVGKRRAARVMARDFGGHA